KAPSPLDKKYATQLMEAVGTADWITDESLMDAVTAVSGSGPAYVFLFIESLVKAGMTAGLEEKMARTLATQTVRDSTIFAENTPESLEQLRKNVTSPGGTTEAALKVLMQGDALENLMRDAVLAATKRSKELS
ncbi:MAG: pyrroline-5-carboxylate reductase, partial [Pseudomonadota bacterium]|nr:pyrroline-5-carboxylate reductase [Pseudomonadota bacterium]